MRLEVTGRNVEVTPAIRAHAERKLRKLAPLLPPATRLELQLTIEHNRSIAEPQLAEITAWTRGPVLRARVGGRDLYAAIDGASERLERQVKRYRERRQRR